MLLLKFLRGRRGLGIAAIIGLVMLAAIAHHWLVKTEIMPVYPIAISHRLPKPDGQLGEVDAVAVSRDGKTFACMSGQGMIIIWDALQWQVRKAWLDRYCDIGVLAMSPDGKRVVSEDPSGAGILQFWNAADGKLLWTIPATDQPQMMAFSPDSQRLAIEGGDGSLAVWEVAKHPRQLWKLPGLTIGMQGSQAVVFSHDGALLVSTGGPCGAGKAALWNTRTGKCLRIFNDQYGAFGHLALSSDNNLLATEGENPRWKAPTGEFLTEASFAHALVVKIWNTRNGRVMRSFPGGWNTSGGTHEMFFTPQGEQLVCCRDDAIDIWRITDGKRLRHYDSSLWTKPELMQDGASALFPDERRLIGRNGKLDGLCVWDLRTGKVIRRITKWR